MGAIWALAAHQPGRASQEKSLSREAIKQDVKAIPKAIAHPSTSESPTCIGVFLHVATRTADFSAAQDTVAGRQLDHFAQCSRKVECQSACGWALAKYLSQSDRRFSRLPIAMAKRCPESTVRTAEKYRTMLQQPSFPPALGRARNFAPANRQFIASPGTEARPLTEGAHYRFATLKLHIDTEPTQASQQTIGDTSIRLRDVT